MSVLCESHSNNEAILQKDERTMTTNTRIKKCCVHGSSVPKKALGLFGSIGRKSKSRSYITVLLNPVQGGKIER